MRLILLWSSLSGRTDTKITVCTKSRSTVFFGGPANSFNNYSGMQTTHATRLLQRGVSDPHKCYVSKDIDASLPSLLTEAMKLLEARFMNLDQGKRSLQALGFTPL